VGAELVLVAQVVVAALDRGAADLQRFGQQALGRQAGACRQLAAGDQRIDLPLELQVIRLGGLGVQRELAEQAPGRGGFGGVHHGLVARGLQGKGCWRLSAGRPGIYILGLSMEILYQLDSLWVSIGVN